MTDLSEIARNIEGAARDLEIDNALEAYAQALTLEATMKRMDESQLKLILGGGYSYASRDHMEARLMQNTFTTRRAYEEAAGIEDDGWKEIVPVNPYDEIKRGDWVGD